MVSNDFVRQGQKVMQCLHQEGENRQRCNNDRS
jgi:hypothetical protein